MQPNILPRRNFLVGMLAMPAIIRPGILMPVRSIIIPEAIPTIGTFVVVGTFEYKHPIQHRPGMVEHCSGHTRLYQDGHEERVIDKREIKGRGLIPIITKDGTPFFYSSYDQLTWGS